MVERERCSAFHSGMLCDKWKGHDGHHRGYNAQIDEPMFWPEPIRSAELLAFIFATVNAVGDMVSKTEAIDAIQREWNATFGEIRNGGQ